MDSQKFDSLVKTLGAPSSRRRIVKGAAVAGLGSLLALGARQTTEAAQCDNGHYRCAGECIPNGHVCVKGGGKPQGSPRGQV
jgi:hypothetical protein